MHASNINLAICFLCALFVQQMPMAFAARPLKGTRGGVHARTLQDETLASEESVDDLLSADDGTGEDTSPSADSGDSKTGRLSGPSERECTMCKFQN